MNIKHINRVYVAMAEKSKAKKFIIDVLSGKIASIDTDGRNYFKAWYETLLENGEYLATKDGQFIFSMKFPEKALKQLAEIDSFMDNVFFRVEG